MKSGSEYAARLPIPYFEYGRLRQNELEKSMFAGELALDGTIRPIRSAITLAETAKKAGFLRIFKPRENAKPSGTGRWVEILSAFSLREIFLHLKIEVRIQPFSG